MTTPDPQSTALITNSIGVMAVIMMIPVVFVWIEHRTKWRIFDYCPPIVWIMITPLFISNFGLIPFRAPVYEQFKSFAVPLFIVIMLLDINIRALTKIAARAIGVLMFGAFGVVIGCILAAIVLSAWLDPNAWQDFAILAATWIGGSGNMVAVAEGIHAPAIAISLVLVTDTIVGTLWFPLVFACKRWAEPFNRFTGVTEQHTRTIEAALERYEEKGSNVHYHDLLKLFGIGFTAIFAAHLIAPLFPEIPPVFTTKTWMTLLVTTIGIALSATPLKRIHGTNAVSMALVYIYMSIVGAEANVFHLSLGHGFLFIIAATFCILVHTGSCVLGARILHVDVHLTAVASIANIGGAASAPVVAAYHRKELVPIAIVLALLGYAMGNYLALLTGQFIYLILR